MGFIRLHDPNIQTVISPFKLIAVLHMVMGSNCLLPANLLAQLQGKSKYQLARRRHALSMCTPFQIPVPPHSVHGSIKAIDGSLGVFNSEIVNFWNLTKWFVCLCGLSALWSHEKRKLIPHIPSASHSSTISSLLAGHGAECWGARSIMARIVWFWAEGDGDWSPGTGSP